METPLETPYSIAEAAALTGWSRQTVTEAFANEPGVLVLERPTKNRKRRYRTITIPRAVFARVMTKYTR